jgi:carbon storage regulator CsrA
MLVLTRKMDEAILIGNDIKITLVRVKGNTVRIGIDAPRDIRVVRGELQLQDTKGPVEFELDESEGPFAHPQEVIGKHAKPSKAPHLFVGKVNLADGQTKLTRAPLSGFMSAS